MLFSITFNVPYFDFKTFAWNDEFYNLVSIIVDEDTYNEEKSDIERYSKDIQGVLENTKVVILPTPVNTPAFNIASLNESLFYEWYRALDKKADFESKLIWTVIIWDFNLPSVYNNKIYSKTILPLTDFDDKVYIYNPKTERYEKNNDNKDWLKPDIWHWVITPNLWSFDKNIKWLKDYFDKNHDYYTWSWNFKYSAGVINWNNADWIPSDYKPYVFYFDQLREEKALSYNNFQNYEWYLENKEDIIYSRFNKELADKISTKSIWNANKTIWKLLDKVDPNFAKDYKGGIPDTSKVPDVQTRHIIENVTKKYIEIFSKWTMWDFRKNVYNAWRYNLESWDVNVDMIPYLITVLDTVNDEITKDVNTEVEKQIDDVVKKWLSRNIALPTIINNNNTCSDTYQNYLYWKKAEDITSAVECSIYRWSNLNWWTLVEANRWTNINLSSVDNNVLYNQPDRNYCYANLLSGAALSWFWWWNSPLNLENRKLVEWIVELKWHDYKWSITPIFDIWGAKKITDSSKISSPLNCLENNYILAQGNSIGWDWKCAANYRIPTFWPWINWSCTTNNNWWKTYNFINSFEDNYINTSGKIYLDWKQIINFWNVTFQYKSIASYVEHKSPTAEELKKQIDTMSTESLPVDKNRYVDFISAKWEYAKIEYPNLFRLTTPDNSIISLNSISQDLDKILNDKSKEINDLIIKHNPNQLSWKNAEIYDLLKTWAYPSPDLDLAKILKDKADKPLIVWSDSKDLSYYDTVVFSQYWNNLTSVSAKYWFIFDNYLIDQFWAEDNNYFLPKNKKSYEMTYLWATWNAQNMYIKIDPKAKADNPYANIISKNIDLSSTLFWSNIWKSTIWNNKTWNNTSGNKDSTASEEQSDSESECAPPDWVPIWKWLPAIMCRLWDMMPPSISISEWACWTSLLSEDEDSGGSGGGGWSSWNSNSSSPISSSPVSANSNTFLTPEEKKEVLQCNWDVDKNGINDCIEKNLKWWILELSADSEKYYYNTNSILKATIKDRNWKVVRIANSTDINFELVRIEAAKDTSKEMIPSNTKTAYDVNDSGNSDLKKASEYVTFHNWKVRSQLWIANYWIWLKSANANIYLRANIKINDSTNNESIFLKSKILQINVRWDRLFNLSYKLANWTDWLKIESYLNSVKVSDKTNIFLADWWINNINSIKDIVNNSSTSDEKFLVFLENIWPDWWKTWINYPLSVSFFDGDNKIMEDINVTKEELKTFKPLYSLKKSWSYRLDIKDSNWFKTTKKIELLADLPKSAEINLGTSVLQKWWNISTNFVTIFDKYLNPVIWNLYDLEFSIKWNSVSFLDNWTNKLSTSTYEWYKIFRLKSNDNEWKSEINLSVLGDDWKEIIKTSKTVHVLDDINLSVKPISWEVKVWWWKYSFEVSLRNSKWIILSDFNSRAYLTADNIFLQTTNPYFELKNWVAQIEFTTKNVSGKNIPIEFQVEWLNKIIQKNLTILPDVAMKLDLNLSQNKIEASPEAFSTLEIELKDRYNNLVFNDNSTVTSLEILNQYSNIIKPDKNNSKVTEWKSTFKIFGTVNPWVAYFNVWTNPSLSVNSFNITSSDGVKVIKWVWENALKIETFYFWNNKKLEWKKYNWLYTTLLGSNYWDIYEQDYLAWSLLFQKNNRSLAVTSVLNNPYAYNNILEVNDNWWIKTLYSQSELTQDIEITPTFTQNKLALNIYNKALNIYVWKVFYDFDTNNKLSACEGTITSCIDTKKTSIALKATSTKYSVYSVDIKLIFRDIYWKNLFEVTEDWNINRLWSIEFKFNEKNTWKYLSINVLTGWQVIWELWLNFIKPIITTSKDEALFNSKIANTKNSIWVLLKSASYGAYNNWNTNKKSKIIFYNDPFASNNKLNSFSSDNLYGVENYAKEPWIGWDSWNKSLLEFAAWKTVWESVKDYMSFSVINLWDPVISLKEIKKKLPKTNNDRYFDSTIWKLLSTDDDIVSYETFDYNNDSREDILLVKNDNYLKLLENKKVEQTMLDKWNLAYIADLWAKDLIKTWDFTWDNFDDIFFISKEGKPYLLNNVGKDFTRVSLIDNFWLNWRIVRVEKFDMDKDGIDDLVILDDFWEINIFYGWWTSKIPLFTKLKISDNQGLTLDSGIRNDDALVYFDWLFQPSEVPNANSKIDRFLFVKYPYSKNHEVSNTNNYINWSQELPNDRGSIYFVKSEYSDASWLKVEKRYVDSNGKFVSAGDIVKVEVTLKNVSWSRLNNVVYAEKVPEVFNLDKTSFKSQTDFDIYDGVSWYNYLVDNFDIPVWWSFTYTYETKVRPLKYSTLQVWLFENWEVWDDKYGDIIVKPNNQNCSNATEVYRSLTSKTYQKWAKAPTCDVQKNKLPNNLEQNTVDTDKNWVPDYIDKLLNPSDTTALKAYSQTQLSNMNSDSDSDGLPDDEDSFDMNWSITVDLWALWEKIDSALDAVDNIVQWLNCWFGNESCFASPLNWAPLAPGGDPVFMGMPIWDWLHVNEWIPIFSMITWMYVWPIWTPTVWPNSPFGYDTHFIWAWGILWTVSATNFFRLFVTPTLTWWVWTAICFWWPAAVAGYTVPQAFSPLEPGWNCIVLAKKTFWCSPDWSDWDVWSTGTPYNSWDSSSSVNGWNTWISGNAWSTPKWSYGIINWNCTSQEDQKTAPVKEKIDIYLKEAQRWNVSKTFDFAPSNFTSSPRSNWSLFSVWWGWSWWNSNSWNSSWWNSDSWGSDSSNSDWWNWEIEVSIDKDALMDWNFEDILKIDMKRISPFPSWLMDWVTRQIEEIANKLTDFPTLFIILPDFTWIFDWDWWKTSWNDSRANLDTINIDKNLTGNETIDNGVNKVNSGIKEAYEFISSTPLVYIDQETVNISLPWISESEIDRAIFSRESTLEQREDELSNASDSLSLWTTCKYTNPKDQKACEENNQASVQVSTNARWLVSSLRDNIEVIKSYKEIPERINDLIHKKEDYLEQILCNIDTISYILGWRIWKNGIRFKAWVELYTLIKAILKSWQLLVDVFLDYEEECHDCKNERQDALEWEFSLISMILPKIPVIRFPKWPDIILDLHNIRAWLIVTLPEFNITSKPIILPNLPELYLPSAPGVNVNINLPKLPVLPKLEIPKLPDLPTLPKIELPDLPPPPKLPKLLSSIEVILDIIKLIMKAMCILKSSPLHPEWRAWDQIAFLTERTWYLPFDFFEATLPEFSFPFVDAIKVTTYVNLEFEADFIVEMARQIAMPINAFTSDFTNIFNIDINDVDMRDIVPSSIDVNISTDWVDGSVWSLNIQDKLSILFAKKVSTDIQHLALVLEQEKSKTVDNLEFKKLVNDSLASNSVISNPKMDKIREVWNEVNNMTYSNEDKLIKELQKNNKEKFDTVSDIINTEIIKNKELKKQLQLIWKKSIVTKVWFTDKNKIESYNETLSKYNEKFTDTAKKLMDWKWDGIKEELKETSKDLINSISTPLKKYTTAQESKNYDNKSSNEDLSYNSNLIAANTKNTVNYSNILAVNEPIANTTSTANSCQANANSPYKYTYKWLYVIESGVSYRLFDYLDELTWNEETKSIDIDNDNDDDLLYFTNGQLFLKNNMNEKPVKSYVKTNPIVVNSKNNKFYNWDIFYEAINNAREVESSSSNILFWFSSPNNNKINNFRLWFYQFVDKYSNEYNSSYIPWYIKKDVVDAIAWIDESTTISKNALFTTRNNLVYINNVWNLKWVKLKTKELINIKQDLEANNVVNVSKWTKLYAWWNSFSLKYVEVIDIKKVKSLTVDKNQNIEFNDSVKIIWLSGNAYIKWSKDMFYEWTSIRNHLNKPLFPETTITYEWANNELLKETYVDLKYYDDSEFWIDFSKTSSWELYDLWYKTSDYYVRLNRENNFYYAKINSFKDNIDWTISSQILLSPQKESDNTSPELNLDSIKVPVYLNKTIDLTPFVYEDSWIKNIKKVIVDMDLTKDTNGDWDPKNDDDWLLHWVFKDKVKVIYSLISLKLEFWKYDDIFKKKIWITMIDDNKNVWYKEVNFEVYSPIPDINAYDNNSVKWNVTDKLWDIPVNLYKFRWWVISNLKSDKGELKTYTIQDWKYTFWKKEPVITPWLKLYREWVEIGNIDESTWKITLTDLSLTTKVLSSTNKLNDNSFPKIIVSDKWQDIFYEYIQMHWVNKVTVVDDFEKIKEKWIYFQLTNPANYGYYSTPENLDYNPWALSIYKISDVAKEWIFTIFNDWRINNLNDDYNIEYVANEKTWYFRLMDTRLGREIWKIMFISDSNYIMK